MAYSPKDAIKHIVHDYVYLVAAGTDVQRSRPHPFNHYAERTFLVHCRALGDFFSGKGDPRDLYARQFTVRPFVRTVQTWSNWNDHIDKHLMHLTKGRAAKKNPWTGEANKLILEEFRVVWREFLKELKDDLKPLFDREIDGHRTSFQGYQL